MALLLHFPTPEDGKNAYETWIEEGNTGTFADYLAAITGAPGNPGKSAYQVAQDNGYIGTEAQWLESLKVKGDDGKSAYQIAKDNGYSGTEAEWAQQMTGIKNTISNVNPKDAAFTFISGSWVRIGSMYTVYLRFTIGSTGSGHFTLTIPSITIPPIQHTMYRGTNIVQLYNNPTSGGSTFYYTSAQSDGTYNICFSFIV